MYFWSYANRTKTIIALSGSGNDRWCERWPWRVLWFGSGFDQNFISDSPVFIGGGLLAYVICWIVMPAASKNQPEV